jgi:pyruvate dehydrogenase (quinone)
MGLHATAVDDPEQLGRAWDAALTAEQPTLLDVRTDLEVPPIPPHVTYDQMKSTAEAIIKGDLFAEIAKNNAAELLPH